MNLFNMTSVTGVRCTLFLRSQSNIRCGEDRMFSPVSAMVNLPFNRFCLTDGSLCVAHSVQGLNCGPTMRFGGTLTETPNNVSKRNPKNLLQCLRYLRYWTIWTASRSFLGDLCLYDTQAFLAPLNFLGKQYPLDIIQPIVYQVS